MKKYLTLSFLLASLVTDSFAVAENEAWKNFDENRDSTINVYGVASEADVDQDSSAGAGIMFDSEALKVKAEVTSDFFKTGALIKVNPFTPNLYFKLGLNYINQTLYSPVDTSTRVNQYSGAVATGYMLTNSFYAEVGGSTTTLSGDVFGDYEVADESTSLAYIEVAKRWESVIGTVDTTANAGQVFHDFSDDEASYGVGVDYYPMDNTKLSYTYQYEKENIVNIYKAQYSLAFVEYNDNISNETYRAMIGVGIAFGNLLELSSYNLPSNIKTHLSELHRFENIVFNKNMNLQTTNGVQKITPKIVSDTVSDVNTTAEDENTTTPPAVNQAPVWTQSSYNTGLTIEDDSDVVKSILDLTTVSSDADGDTITYSIISITVPGSQTAWNNSLSIDANGILNASNLQTNDPNIDGDITVVVRATDGSASNDTEVIFGFNNVQ